LPLTLSARTPQALQALAARYAHHLVAHPDLDLADICRTANGGRSHFSHRLALVTSSLPSLISLLDIAQTEQPHPQIYRGRSGADAPAVAFVFPDGLPPGAIASQLHPLHPLLEQALDRWQAVCGVDALKPDSAIAVMATQYALAQLWIDWGIAPRMLTGWGLGRLTAACVAGGISLADGLRLAIAYDQGMGNPAAADPWAELRAIAPVLSYQPPAYSLLDSGGAGQSVLPADWQGWCGWLTQPTDGQSLAQALAHCGVEMAIALGAGPEGGEAIAPASFARATTGDRFPAGPGPQWLASVQADGEVWSQLMSALAQLYVRGASINWRQVYGGGRPVSLPTYPFQRQYFGIE
ncbi:MAG: hypothetical protein ACFB8W_20260, partial [Elainellaceae cyanobacterium]